MGDVAELLADLRSKLYAATEPEEKEVLKKTTQPGSPGLHFLQRLRSIC